MSIKEILALGALAFPLLSYAQSKDSLTFTQDSTDMTSMKRSSVVPYIIPMSLMSYGTAEAIVMNKGRMLNYAIGHEVITHKPIAIGIDDYTQYVPAVSVLALNLCGVKSCHNLKEQTMLLGLSSLQTAISVNGLKYTVREMRPNGSRRNSFPSGHTTVAFMGAELLWQEYKDTSPWIGIGGYVIAASTGALRVYNNKHWIGDVAFGAGLGILCTKLAYKLYEPISRKMHNKQSKRTNTVYPYYNGQQGGLALTIQL